MAKNWKNLFWMIFPALLVASCGGSEPASEEGNTDVEELTDEMFDEMLQESDASESHLPDATSIMYMFSESGLNYIPNTTHENETAAKYLSKDKQMLNFGVYITDMVYAAQSGKFDEAKEDLKVAKELAGSFGLESIFASKEFMERIDKNMENKDSMFAVMGELYLKGQDYMQEQGMRLENYVLFTGAWIEAIYLGAQDYRKNHNKALLSKLADQMLVLNALIEGLANGADDSQIYMDMAEGLSKLKSSYEGLESVKAASTTRTTPELTDAEVDQLSEIVGSLRAEIINI